MDVIDVRDLAKFDCYKISANSPIILRVPIDHMQIIECGNKFALK